MEIIKAGARANQKASSKYYTGIVWKEKIFEAPLPARTHTVKLVFEPSARTAWHKHPLGQTIYVTKGVGLICLREEKASVIEAGDTVWISPNQEHWHGTNGPNNFEYISIQEELDGCNTEWLEKVSDEDYQISIQVKFSVPDTIEKQVPPTIPSRLVIPYRLEPWTDILDGFTLSEHLNNQCASISIDWSSLSRKIFYAVNSDGNVPPEVSQKTKNHLDVLSNAALEHLEQRKNGQIKADNSSLKFLTFQFKRCPEKLVTEFIGLIPHRYHKNFKHPFIKNTFSWEFIYGGLGRITHSHAAERKVIKAILSTPVEEWLWREQTRCISFLLATSDTAPTCLKRQDVETLARRIEIEFSEIFTKKRWQLSGALFPLVSLLRYRLVEPEALVVGKDPLADSFKNLVEQTVSFIEQIKPEHRLYRRHYLHKIYILEGILAELSGQGRSHTKLLDVYNF